jgi:hypothetical protein
VKTDLRKTLDSYRARAGEFRVLDLPPLRYLMVDGSGDPDTAPAYAEALAALYPVAYRLKFAAKAAGHDHVGPYDAEGPVLAELHDRFIPGAGLAMTGRHHEIYLNDARRTAPERLRTILRQPVVTG